MIVSLRILLPVAEVIGGRDTHRITDNFGSTVRRRPKPDHLRPQRNKSIVLIIGFVMNGDAYGHWETVVRATEKFVFETDNARTYLNHWGDPNGTNVGDREERLFVVAKARQS